MKKLRTLGLFATMLAVADAAPLDKVASIMQKPAMEQQKL